MNETCEWCENKIPEVQDKCEHLGYEHNADEWWDILTPQQRQDILDMYRKFYLVTNTNIDVVIDDILKLYITIKEKQF